MNKTSFVTILGPSFRTDDIICHIRWLYIIFLNQFHFFFFFTLRALKIKNASAMHGLVLKAKSDIQKKWGFELVIWFTVKLKHKLPTQPHQSLPTSCFLLSLFHIFTLSRMWVLRFLFSNKIKLGILTHYLLDLKPCLVAKEGPKMDKLFVFRDPC